MPLLCGLDEAGRGPLAGPIVAAAVVFPPDFDFAVHFGQMRFGDSKKLSRPQREKAYEVIVAQALIWQFEQIDPVEIDARDIGWANRTVFERLIARIAVDRYIVDGNLKLSVAPHQRGAVQCLVKADASQPAVSAASIIAKVTRDRVMDRLHAEYPDYGWDRNAGYCTAAHMAAIRANGTTPHHRHKFVESALRNSTRPETIPLFQLQLSSQTNNQGQS
jgi:ribonuclease HII